MTDFTIIGCAIVLYPFLFVWVIGVLWHGFNVIRFLIFTGGSWRYHAEELLGLIAMGAGMLAVVCLFLAI